jgi:hypothetical protein
MKPQTAEWVEKAEGDWNAARQLNRVRKDPNYDSVCFHLPLDGCSIHSLSAVDGASIEGKVTKAKGRLGLASERRAT